jgi:hypothetical protein
MSALSRIVATTPSTTAPISSSAALAKVGSVDERSDFLRVRAILLRSGSTAKTCVRTKRSFGEAKAKAAHPSLDRGAFLVFALGVLQLEVGEVERQWREALGDGLERCKDGVKEWLVDNGGWVDGLDG